MTVRYARAEIEGADCTHCPLREKEGPVYQFLPREETPLPFDILWCLERPGNNELTKGEPIAGRSGWLIDKLFSGFGIKRAHFGATNATLCTQRTYLSASPWNRAIACCSKRLVVDIHTHKRPGRKLLVFLAGDKALHAVTTIKKFGVGMWRGFPVDAGKIRDGFPKHEVIYVPVCHPSAVLREAALLWVWKQDIQNALEFAAGRLQPYRWPSIYTGCSPEVYSRLEEISRGLHRRLGFDTETAGIEPLVAPLICNGFSTQDFAISFPVGRDARFDALLREILLRKDITLVVQNGNHDLIEMAAQGFVVCCQSRDILSAGRVRYPRLAHDLQNLASYFHFIEKWKLIYRGDKGNEQWAKALKDESELERMMEYNAKDAHGTFITEAPLDTALAAVSY